MFSFCAAIRAADPAAKVLAKGLRLNLPLVSAGLSVGRGSPLRAAMVCRPQAALAVFAFLTLGVDISGILGPKNMTSISGGSERSWARELGIVRFCLAGDLLPGGERALGLLIASSRCVSKLRSTTELKEFS